jgi:hypothetical protein
VNSSCATISHVWKKAEIIGFEIRVSTSHHSMGQLGLFRRGMLVYSPAQSAFGGLFFNAIIPGVFRDRSL